ncbi:hypothetical protein [Pseudomonas proteolytica]|jgi:hypothetical protein|uniref:hypothetical protein n=1 Tax=Pseudomonas proteolytica TaxID=219574 RepID=UPI000899EBFB|nr:hypothetical protein [Pseudomonas proteolytica]TDR48095.1 hypothetical protein EDF80_103216 [Pseudomonas brenneri]KAA8700779.1 hypothetical protein F4W61_16965 [Pseudomonas proteolytica]MDF3160644.1 hypothetical protein [Pseudomonas proteolytica]NMZ06629.1 hypothetical protein [Pseudomonas proteolytica]NMZ33457.1 hypothetical protein [Pseudomonas proteolytica]
MMMLWQAHLTFILLGFVLLGSLRCLQSWRPWLLPGLALVSFIPLNDLPLAAYVRSFTDDLAISTLVLLGWVSLVRLGLVEPQEPRARAQMLVLFGLLAALLYPATMGLTYFDPYRWGFNPRPMIVLVALLALGLLWLRNTLAVWMLALGTLAFALRLKASENYWDYLIDPLLVGYCLVAGSVLCVKSVKLHRGQ